MWKIFAPTQKKMYYSTVTTETEKGCCLELTSLKFTVFFPPTVEAYKENYVHRRK